MICFDGYKALLLKQNTEDILLFAWRFGDYSEWLSFMILLLRYILTFKSCASLIQKKKKKIIAKSTILIKKREALNNDDLVKNSANSEMAIKRLYSRILTNSFGYHSTEM